MSIYKHKHLLFAGCRYDAGLNAGCSNTDTHEDGISCGGKSYKV